MIVAGEDSGDKHAAHLVDALKQKDASLSFIGLGGPQMQASGVDLFEDLTKISVVGFFEVLKHYNEFKSLFDRFLKQAEEIKPACVILVDYPGFNLRMAKELKKRGIKVIYYISPQVWAWKRGRIKQIESAVDKILVIFKFEETLYRECGIDATFVGHPLLDAININKKREEFLNAIELSKDHLTVGLLPGSRTKEVERHLPVMIDACKTLHAEFPQIQFLILKAQSIDKKILEEAIEDVPFAVKIVDQSYYDGINACDYCIVSSGTATLEVALLEKPMVIMYKTSWPTYFLAKLMITIPHIGLVNVIAQKQVVPECIQQEATGGQIANKLKTIFVDENKISEIKKDLKAVRQSLDCGGASEKASEIILDSLN